MAVQQSRQRTRGIIARTQELIDGVITPETRSEVLANVSTFASEQPLLASFVFIQILLSFTPVALFASFAVGTILVSSIAALLFSLFWLGVALLVLLPVLFVTVSLGLAVWIWAISSFIIARWIYNLIPINVRGGVDVEMPNGKTMTVNKTGDGFGDIKAQVQSKT